MMANLTLSVAIDGNDLKVSGLATTGVKIYIDDVYEPPEVPLDDNGKYERIFPGKANASKVKAVTDAKTETEVLL